MIKRLGVKNYCSFNEGVEINFELDKKVPDEVRQGLVATTVLGIKGANGSGKTNIIKVIEFLNQFCAHSAKNKEDDDIEVVTFFHNENPTEVYIEFCVDDMQFHYELEVTKTHVIKEILYRTNSRKVKVFERKYDEIVECIDDVSELKNIVIKSNASILSIYKTYKFKSPMVDLSLSNLFFYKIISNVNYFGYYDREFDYRKASEEYEKDQKLFSFVKHILMSADNGIQDIKIHQTTDSEGKEYSYPIFSHNHNGEVFNLTYYAQSSGTKALFKKMYMYWLVLSSGGILALDEFDIHIHSMVLPLLINLFANKETNKYNSQFIFTAHNSEVIDTLGKYRTILVNKEDNVSYCYRLDEISGSMVRNDRAITPLYLKKKLGGVPHINDEGFNLGV